MALLIVQVEANKNQHAATAAEELANRIDRGNPLRVAAGWEDIGIRFAKRKWIAAGKAAADFPFSYVVVDITDMTDAEAQRLCEPYPLPTAEVPDPDIVYARRWVFSADQIAPERQAELITNGELVTTRALLNTAMIDQAGLMQVSDI